MINPLILKGILLFQIARTNMNKINEHYIVHEAYNAPAHIWSA